MILLTYISGLLTTVGIVMIVAFVRAYKKYTLLLESNQHISNITSIRTAESQEKLMDIEDIVRVIQNDFIPNGKIDGELMTIKTDLGHLSNAIRDNRKFSELAKKQLLEGNLMLRKNLDSIREDPGSISRY